MLGAVVRDIVLGSGERMGAVEEFGKEQLGPGLVSARDGDGAEGGWQPKLAAHAPLVGSEARPVSANIRIACAWSINLPDLAFPAT